MSKLNREQITKALEYCKSPKLTKCNGCPREQEDGHCMYRLNEDALSLIKELTEEKNEISEVAGRRLYNLELSYLTLEAENSKLTEDIVREMVEMLTNFFSNDEITRDCEVDAEYINEQISRIANELMEGKR